MSVDIRPKTKGTKKLFNNKFLESLTRTHVSIPISLFITYSAGLLYYSIVSVQVLSILETFLLFFAGLFAFTLVEYLMHRFLFHIPTNTKRRKKIQYTLHGVHHEFPKDKQRLAMPPIMSITLATSFLFLFKLFLGDMVFAFLPGFLVGYAGYLCMHYILHIFPPPKNRFKKLWELHAIHHYKDQTKVYGVSTPLWDIVFRTMP